jgi:hypothetical protein
MGETGRRSSVAGFGPNIGAFLASEPNAWGWTGRRSVQSEADEEFANDQRLTTNGGICGR